MSILHKVTGGQGEPLCHPAVRLISNPLGCRESSSDALRFAGSVCVCHGVSLHNLERQSSGFPSLQMPGDEYLLSHPFYPCSPHHFLCLSPSPSLSRTSLSILSALLCPLCFVLLSSLFFVPPVCFFLDSILLD